MRNIASCDVVNNAGDANTSRSAGMVTHGKDLRPGAAHLGFSIGRLPDARPMSAGHAAVAAARWLCHSRTCLFVGPGFVVSSGPGGAIHRSVSLLVHPTPTGPVSVGVGERWHYQLWHRDTQAGAVTSNFTDGVFVDYQ